MRTTTLVVAAALALMACGGSETEEALAQRITCSIYDAAHGRLLCICVDESGALAAVRDAGSCAPAIAP